MATPVARQALLLALALPLAPAGGPAALPSASEFPLGWYGNLAASTANTTVRNVIIGGPPRGTGQPDPCHDPSASACTDEISTQLDGLHAQRVAAIIPIPRTLSLWKYYNHSKADIHAFVRRLVDHPAVFGWYLFDEPHLCANLTKWSCAGASADVLEEAYDAVRAADPHDRPVAIAIARSSWATAPAQFSGATDALMYDDYVSDTGRRAPTHAPHTSDPHPTHPIPNLWAGNPKEPALDAAVPVPIPRVGGRREEER